ncbi:hypothetical protein JOC94_003572 [Bacillus thermophilus]|uniref:DUF4901 domain-containing protein n=2 Tax=Bacillaceae TaxID=186817 RepID=A0ABS2RA70_9BACI|nr:hypothetical protein [Siminovitchia thermophila]ONK24107.1 hypothetical protein BLX87_06410 [Bacillus sp. VT-16-64]
MEKIVAKLRPYIVANKEESLVAKPTEYDQNTYKLIFVDSQQVAGEVVLTEDGCLKMFSEFDFEEEDIPEASMSKEEIRKLIERFSHDFFPESFSLLHLSSIFDLDIFYLFDYVRKDERFGLELPNSGISFSVYKNGVIMDMVNEMDEFLIVYPDRVLSEEVARERFLTNIQPLLKIMRFDEKVYVDGDGEFKLVYDFLHTTGIDVKMDGNQTTLADFGDVCFPFQSLPQMPPVQSSIYAMAGVETMDKITESDTPEGKLEVWSDFPKEHFLREYEFDELMDLDTVVEGAVKLITDSNGMLKQMITSDRENGVRITEEEAFQSALKLLYSQYPDAQHMFKLRGEDHVLIEFDEEGEELPPHAYCFTFDRFEKDVQVEGEYLTIIVSAYSGKLCEWFATDYLHDRFTHLVENIPDHFGKALQRYQDSFVMKLNWTKEEVDEEGKPHYELVYMPEFKGTGGHVHCVEVAALKPWIVNVTGLEEFR